MIKNEHCDHETKSKLKVSSEKIVQN